MLEGKCATHGESFEPRHGVARSFMQGRRGPCLGVAVPRQHRGGEGEILPRRRNIFPSHRERSHSRRMLKGHCGRLGGTITKTMVRRYWLGVVAAGLRGV